MLIIFYNFSMRFLIDTIYKSLCNDYCFAYVKVVSLWQTKLCMKNTSVKMNLL